MKINNTIKLIIVSAFIFTGIGASAEGLSLEALIRGALETNADIMSAEYDLSAQRLKLESVIAGALPGLSFTTDTGNNPLYRFSEADELNTSTFDTERYRRHKTGAGLSLGAALPTGGSLSLTGAGSLEFSALAEDDADWNYLLSPAVSLYLRQPLFIDRLKGSILSFDNLKAAEELAALEAEQTELAGLNAGNSIIIAVVRTAAVLNNLLQSYDLLQQRLEIAEQRLELAYQDESAGRLSRLDSLTEELQIRKQNELLAEIRFQIESAVNDLRVLTGIDAAGVTAPDDAVFIPDAEVFGYSASVNPFNSSRVRQSEAARRSQQLASTAIQNGKEPVFEVSGLWRRSDSDTAADFSAAVDDALAAGMNLSLSMSVSFDAFDWGEAKKTRLSEQEALKAADKRLESAMKNAEALTAAAQRNIELIEQKYSLISRGLEYDRTLLERERIRFESGLSSELNVRTVELDLLDREYQLRQLEDEKVLALFELYNTGGVDLKDIFQER